MKQYTDFFDMIALLLKAKGFVKKGATFYILKDNNWGLINFQKSNASTAELISFTINLGIYSNSLRNLSGTKILIGKPNISDCHWDQRIGFLMPIKKDYWWHIDNNTDVENITNEITELLNTIVINEIESHISDQSLEREWLQGVSPGLTKLERYKYLTTLLKLSSNKAYDSIIKELKEYSKGKPFEEIVMEHISYLDRL